MSVSERVQACTQLFNNTDRTLTKSAGLPRKPPQNPKHQNKHFNIEFEHFP